MSCRNAAEQPSHCPCFTVVIGTARLPGRVPITTMQWPQHKPRRMPSWLPRTSNSSRDNQRGLHHHHQRSTTATDTSWDIPSAKSHSCLSRSSSYRYAAGSAMHHLLRPNRAMWDHRAVSLPLPCPSHRRSRHRPWRRRLATSPWRLHRDFPVRQGLLWRNMRPALYVILLFKQPAVCLSTKRQSGAV